MSAGTGVQHSEYNLEDTLCRLFQIWIIPRTRGVAPAWSQREFPKADRSGAFTVLASGYDDAGGYDQGALPINANARVLGATMKNGGALDYDVGEGRSAYLVVAKGRIRISGQYIDVRDGVAIGPGALHIEAVDDAEIVMVDSE